MKVAICGPALPEKAELLIPGASPAAAKYLRNMAKAFQNMGYDVKMFSYITAPLTENAKNLITNTHDGNIYIGKERTIISSLTKFRKYFLDSIESCDLVLFYNISYASWGLNSSVKRLGAKSVLILADHTESNECKGTVRKIMAKINEYELQKFHQAIILSEKAKRILNNSCDTLLLEGGIDLTSYVQFDVPTWGEKKKILYSGMLSKVAGVDLLIEAFKSVQTERCELWITGKGELDEFVRLAAKENKSIKYKGFVRNDEFYQILNSVDIVINPRNMNYTQNVNNFPSKVLEYLASGRVVLSTRFPGYQRFEECINFCDSEPKAIADSINRLINLSSADIAKGYAENRKFASGFSWDNQVNEILRFVGEK